ncbi:MAG: arsenate reductase ArsC [Rhodanobacteraceae bacterium]|nr:MAG: arsenate reductase ArsC [Rhodanobacteraceae bacterium]
MTEPRQRILFICTGNACRSQMAEAWTRHLLGDRIEAFSAGTAPHAMDPRALAVMRECGVDMSGQRPKPLADVSDLPFDLVVTVCDHAATACPVWPGTARTVHHGFDDPPRLARGAKDEREALQAYRRVRDQIRDFVQMLAAGKAV